MAVLEPNSGDHNFETDLSPALAKKLSALFQMTLFFNKNNNNKRHAITQVTILALAKWGNRQKISGMLITDSQRSKDGAHGVRSSSFSSMKV